MKLIVEFELNESWEAYIPDNEEKLKNIIQPMLSGIKAKILNVLPNTPNDNTEKK